MSLKETILSDMKSAMRERDRLRLETIRLLRAAIQRQELDDRAELNDQGVFKVIQKMLKQCADAANQFAQGGREELAEKEKGNIRILQTYLPEPLCAAEIEEIINAAMVNSGANSIKEMGKVMKLVKDKVQGRADMAVVSKKIKSLLT